MYGPRNAAGSSVQATRKLCILIYSPHIRRQQRHVRRTEGSVLVRSVLPNRRYVRPRPLAARQSRGYTPRYGGGSAVRVQIVLPPGCGPLLQQRALQTRRQDRV